MDGKADWFSVYEPQQGLWGLQLVKQSKVWLRRSGKVPCSNENLQVPTLSAHAKLWLVGKLITSSTSVRHTCPCTGVDARAAYAGTLPKPTRCRHVPCLSADYL